MVMKIIKKPQTEFIEKKENFIECECGAKINGRSNIHAKSLMHAHLNSRIHKERLDAMKKLNEL